MNNRDIILGAQNIVMCMRQSERKARHVDLGAAGGPGEQQEKPKRFKNMFFDVSWDLRALLGSSEGDLGGYWDYLGPLGILLGYL